MHPEKLVSKLARERLSAALHRIAPGESSGKLVRLFAGRATPAQIRSWRLARRGAPQWAIDCLANALRERAQVDLDTAAQLLPGLGQSHTIGRDALHNYRRKRALEREKAGG